MQVEAGQCVEIVRVRPKPDAASRLMEIRDDVVDSYRQKSPAFVRATLLKPEDGDTWVDIWIWTDRQGAEAALADMTPPFKEWADLVDIVQFEWAEVTDDAS